MTKKPPDTSIGRHISPFGFCLYASQTYRKKTSKLPLHECNWLLADDSRDWFPPQVWKKLGLPKANVVFRSNSIMAVLNAALDGMGIAPLPCFLGDSERKLERVIELKEEMKLDLWLLTHPDLRHTARVSALMQYLREQLGKQKGLLQGYND